MQGSILFLAGVACGKWEGGGGAGEGGKEISSTGTLVCMYT